MQTFDQTISNKDGRAILQKRWAAAPPKTEADKPESHKFVVNASCDHINVVTKRRKNIVYR